MNDESIGANKVLSTVLVFELYHLEFWLLAKNSKTFAEVIDVYCKVTNTTLQHYYTVKYRYT